MFVTGFIAGGALRCLVAAEPTTRASLAAVIARKHAFRRLFRAFRLFTDRIQAIDRPRVRSPFDPLLDAATFRYSAFALIAGIEVCLDWQFGSIILLFYRNVIVIALSRLSIDRGSKLFDASVVGMENIWKSSITLEVRLTLTFRLEWRNWRSHERVSRLP